MSIPIKDIKELVKNSNDILDTLNRYIIQVLADSNFKYIPHEQEIVSRYIVTETEDLLCAVIWPLNTITEIRIFILNDKIVNWWEE